MKQAKVKNTSYGQSVFYLKYINSTFYDSISTPIQRDSVDATKIRFGGNSMQNNKEVQRTLSSSDDIQARSRMSNSPLKTTCIRENIFGALKPEKFAHGSVDSATDQCVKKKFSKHRNDCYWRFHKFQQWLGKYFVNFTETYCFVAELTQHSHS